MVTSPRLYTSGDIAKALNAKVTRVRHILATRDQIRPVGRAGLVRLYDRQAVALIRHELNAIDARQEGGTDG